MKKSVIAILLAAAMLLPGCAPSEPVATVSVTPHYNQPEVKTPSPTPAASFIEVTITADMIKEEFQITFTGLERSEESPKHGNSPFSLYSESVKPPSPYYDEATDTLFYVSYGNDRDIDGKYMQLNDYYLYALKGESNEPVIEMPVNYPNFYGDYIYFMSNESAYDLYGFNYPPVGKIYRYKKSNESIELVLEQDINEFSIVGDYLYFQSADIFTFNSDGTRASYTQGEPFRMSLEGGEPEPTDGFLPQFYGEYQLRYTPLEKIDEYGGYTGALELVSEHETVKLGDAFFSSSYGFNFIIYENRLWFTCWIDEVNSLVSIDLPTGETSVYTFPISKRNNGYVMSSYTVLDGKIFVAISPDIYKFDDDLGRFVKMSTPESFTGSPFYIRTDGRYVYAVTIIGTDGRKDYPTHLVRIDILEDGQYETFVISTGDNHPSFGLTHDEYFQKYG